MLKDSDQIRVIKKKPDRDIPSFVIVVLLTVCFQLIAPKIICVCMT